MRLIGTLIVLLMFATSAFAQPTIGSDCGTGASLAAGSTDLVGKVILGTSPSFSCTLTTSSTHNAACSAEDESGCGGHAFDAGPVTSMVGTPAGMVLTIGPPAQNGFANCDGDVIAYSCQSFDAPAMHHGRH